jgi:hypothetical protein
MIWLLIRAVPGWAPRHPRALVRILSANICLIKHCPGVPGSESRAVRVSATQGRVQQTSLMYHRQRIPARPWRAPDDDAFGWGGARARPAACRVVMRSCPAPAMAPFPVQGSSSLWTVSCCWGGWLVLLRGCDACRTVSGGLQSGAALICVRLDVGSLQPRSSLLTVAGCLLGGFPVGRDLWGGDHIVGGVLPRINIGTWGLCDCLCLVLVCRGRYCWGRGFFSSFWDQVWAE